MQNIPLIFSPRVLFLKPTSILLLAMKQIAVFDFDGTLFSQDTSVAFCLYIYRRFPLRLLFMPIQIFAIILYWCTAINKKKFKELFLIFLWQIDENKLKAYLSDFWKEHFPERFHQSLLSRLDDLIQNNIIVLCVSASPDLLLLPIASYLNIKHVIATRIKKRRSVYIIEGKNCRGNEKIKRLHNQFPPSEFELVEAYSDNPDDLQLLQLAKSGYVVKQNKRKKVDLVKVDA